MKKSTITVAVACVLMGAMVMPSCIGSFSLTNKLLSWNRQVSNKFVNELVFFVFWVLPVYEVSALADFLVLNSIEFWSGENPVASNTRVVEGNDGRYLVMSDKNGYTIKSETDGSVTRLNFHPEDKSWAMELSDGTEQTIFSFVDDTHVALPMPGAESPVVIELSEAGLYAYSTLATASNFALR